MTFSIAAAEQSGTLYLATWANQNDQADSYCIASQEMVGVLDTSAREFRPNLGAHITCTNTSQLRSRMEILAEI